MRYEFDRLGWLNFEWLVQTWLKAEFGFTVESWGGNHDQGKDAYSAGTVKSRTTDTEYSGPIVFQAKFVEQANAIGSDYRSPLLKACNAEAKSLRNRIQQGLWDQPQSYVLITNCPITPKDRSDIGTTLNKYASKVFIIGVKDLSDAIDLRPEIARSYPQILSYRNLITIIQQIQGKDILERSAAALDAAKEVIPVFVPTCAYDQAWRVLKQKNFVVLSGPPEMGKTAIGWMIAMSQVANGWQVVECSTPDDVFKIYDSKVQQLFLADDAFGRTEFNVSRGALWEADLAKVLQRTNKDHLLVWTSRKHILERAMREIDPPGGGKDRFPNPGEVLVQADKLSIKEKALILYRHAVAANLDTSAKTLLKGNLEPIVRNPHFTPERIRRFVRIELPRLDAELRQGGLQRDSVQTAIEKTIEQCTEMMEKSFLKLPDTQKWILVCLLDESHRNTPDKIEQDFARISPVESSRPFSTLLDELNESFVRITESGIHYPAKYTIKTIEWIHPSYRDLVIDSLCKNVQMRHHYLKVGGIPAITLALSQEGGAAGQRAFPLMLDDESWKLLRDNCVSRLDVGTPKDEEAILEIMNSVISGNPPNIDKLSKLATAICEGLRSKWDKNKCPIAKDALEQYYKLTERTSQYMPSPDLETSWDSAWEPIRKIIYDDSSPEFSSSEELTEWAELCELIHNNEPRFLRRIGFPSVAGDAIMKITSIATDNCDDDPGYSDPDEYRGEAERLNEIHSALESLLDVFPSYSDQISSTMATIETSASALEEQASELEAPEQDCDDYERAPSIEVFDIHELFRDL